MLLRRMQCSFAWLHYATHFPLVVTEVTLQQKGEKTHPNVTSFNVVHLTSTITKWFGSGAGIH